ncbi:hypothetical protein GCM10008014_45260 [Paenibacillus silvae]|uniref:Peptidase M56 domain-containing protein n=1 Tax=Paenibacillus silvae TaxID=1325358 RepID=A0ABQ1ZH16_9BACL|nr:M56 family metallopeptidase [Paenibacillus silvae]GGH65660.1 hypothetical protein GCM10008014_45260 [Paenibacillus silvae]
MKILLALFVASTVGSMIWLIQHILRTITEKFFSQTWHYYTSLIPVFFLLGGTEVTLHLFSYIESMVLNNKLDPLSYAQLEKNPFINTVSPFSEYSQTKIVVQRYIDYLYILGNQNYIVLVTLIIWCTGVVIFLGVHIKNYWTFKKLIFQKSPLSYEKNSHGIHFFVSPHALTPMVIGFIKPVIVMPTTNLTPKEKALILSHELVHLNRRDLLVKLIVLLANSIHWFNPMVYFLKKQTMIYCELSCDEKVVQNLNVRDRRIYGETLLSMLEYGVMKRNPIGVSHFYHSKENMKRRLRNLMNVKKKKSSIVLLSVATSLLLISSGGLASSYASAATTPSSQYLLKGGSNVTVRSSDGTSISYDQQGNIIPEPPREPEKKMTTDQVIERIRLHLENNLSVPEGYVTQLKQQGKITELAKLLVNLTEIKLATQDGVTTVSVKEILKP